MDSISRALVRTVEGPRGLLEEVARAAADHLDAEWTLLALADGHLAGARPRFIAIAANGVAYIDEVGLPAYVAAELADDPGGAQRTDDAGERVDRWVRVPMTLEGDTVGALAAVHGLPEGPEPSDVSVLRILAEPGGGVAAHVGAVPVRPRPAPPRAASSTTRRPRRPRTSRSAPPSCATWRTRLHVARQREVIDAERHRIARELHDSVTQYVLSAGMAVEIARGEAEDLGSAGDRDQRAAADREGAVPAGGRAAAAGDLRAAPAAYRHRQDPARSCWPRCCATTARASRPSCGSRATSSRSPATPHHEIARAVGEALFNVAAHAAGQPGRSSGCATGPTRSWSPSPTTASATRSSLSPAAAPVARTSSTDGRHRGLVNIDARLADMGGTIAFRRARLGGVRVEMRLPLPLAETNRPATHRRPRVVGKS